MKLIVDTSVWIEHLKKPQSQLIQLLEMDEVLTHSVVIGELYIGQVKNREEIVSHLLTLPRAREATFHEVVGFVRQRRFYGKGIGWNDAQLLAAALLSNASIFSFEKNLMRIARSL